MNPKSLALLLVLGAAISMPAGARDAQESAQVGSATTTFGFYCEAYGPGRGGYCGANVEGAATPLTHQWGTTGTVILPMLCGASSPICRWSCSGYDNGAMTLSVYDANGYLIGSGYRGVCTSSGGVQH